MTENAIGREKKLCKLYTEPKYINKYLKTKRADYLEIEARKLAEDARADPFLALKKRIPPTMGKTPIET